MGESALLGSREAEQHDDATARWRVVNGNGVVIKDGFANAADSGLNHRRYAIALQLISSALLLRSGAP